MSDYKDKHFVYIIKSQKTGRFYTDLTNDLLRRLEEHDQGRLTSSKTTYSQGPFILIHAEECNTYKKAAQRELFWKFGIGRQIRTANVQSTF